MRIITYSQPGAAEVLKLSEAPIPQPGAFDLLVKIKVAGLNRADIAQREGNYPPPAGHSPILGLEIAGEVVALGNRVRCWQKGDRVFGLVNGGGYAEYGLLDHRLAIPLPESWDYVQGAAVAEAFLTAYVTLFELGELRSKQTVLFHGGGSGVGTAVIQLAHYSKAIVYITAGSSGKIERCLALGANAGINYHTQDFIEIIRQMTQGNGVDVIIDCVGQAYFPRNLLCLKPGGRLIQLAVMSGVQAELNLGQLLNRRWQIKGCSMRRLPLKDKRRITQRFIQRWLPLLQSGKVRPIIDRVFPFTQVQDAHRYMESSQHFGKIVLGWE
ncbi:MAG: NAD(P)H-quinone oxidoreductase [Gammaproteobacteria bacterium]